MGKTRVVKSPLIAKLLKETPIETRLRVMFEMEWLTMNIIPDRHATDDEIKKACDWAKKMVDWTMKDFTKWEKDGRPTARKNGA